MIFHDLQISDVIMEANLEKKKKHKKAILCSFYSEQRSERPNRYHIFTLECTAFHCRFSDGNVSAVIAPVRALCPLCLLVICSLRAEPQGLTEFILIYSTYYSVDIWLIYKSDFLCPEALPAGSSIIYQIYCFQMLQYERFDVDVQFGCTAGFVESIFIKITWDLFFFLFILVLNFLIDDFIELV